MKGGGVFIRRGRLRQQGASVGISPGFSICSGPRLYDCPAPSASACDGSFHIASFSYVPSLPSRRYVSYQAPSSRWDIAMECVPEDDDTGDEEAHEGGMRKDEA